MAVIGTDDDSSVYSALASPIRRQIVDALCARGPLSLKEIAEVGGLQEVTARHHLLLMERAGLVVSEEHRRGRPGRPRRVFTLVNSERNIGLPKRQYAMLVSHLIEASLEAEGATGTAQRLRAIGKALGEDLVATMKEAKGSSDLKVADIARFLVPLLNEHGCCAAAVGETRSSVQVRFRNCIFREVSKELPVLCNAHEALLEAVAAAVGTPEPVTESCMAHGAQECVTRFTTPARRRRSGTSARKSADGRRPSRGRAPARSRAKK